MAPKSINKRQVVRQTPVEKPLKGVNKVGTDGKSVKRKVRRLESYSTYIYKVLKLVDPDTGISKNAMSIVNSFCTDVFERLASEAGRIARYNEKATLSARDIQTAVRLV